MDVCVCLWMCVCVYGCKYVSMYICVCLPRCVCADVCMCVSMDVRVCLWMCVCVSFSGVHTNVRWCDAATHCNTLQHTATHCNTLQQTHGNTLQHTATHQIQSRSQLTWRHAVDAQAAVSRTRCHEQRSDSHGRDANWELFPRILFWNVIQVQKNMSIPSFEAFICTSRHTVELESRRTLRSSGISRRTLKEAKKCLETKLKKYLETKEMPRN